MRPGLLGLVLLVGCGLPDSHTVSGRPDASASGVEVAIPIEMFECDDVMLAVVGAKRAVLGERVTMQASASGTQPSGEAEDSEDTAPPPSLLWMADDLDLTVTGPMTAEVSCGAVGSYDVDVELAPPSRCPATLHLTIECVEPAHDSSDSDSD